MKGFAAAGAVLAHALPWVAAGAWLAPPGPAAAQPAGASSGLERGGALYRSLCLRCHGDSGDDTSYPGIVPLAGIDRRLGAEEIAELSAPFVGRVFRGEEARALVAYLGTLRGQKGFPEPGLLFSAALLDEKRNDVHRYRIVDVRSRAEYDEGHVVNAVHWPDVELLEPTRRGLADLSRVLAELGIRADTFVVVYDAAGGPSAASLWWSLSRAGHTRTAVLDGGWEAWREAGYRVSDAHPGIDPAPAREPAPPRGGEKEAPATEGARVLRFGSGPRGAAPGGSEVWFDWRRTTAPGGFGEATEIARYLDEAGVVPGRYRIEEPGRALGALVLVLRLLGREVEYHTGTRVLSVGRGPGAAGPDAARTR